MDSKIIFTDKELSEFNKEGKTAFFIEGMWCYSCANSIKKKISK